MKENPWICGWRPFAVIMLLVVVVCYGRAQVVTVGIHLVPGIEFRWLPVTRSNRFDTAPSGTSRLAVRWIELKGDENMEILLSCRVTAKESRIRYMNGGSFSPDRATLLTSESRSFVLDRAACRQKNLIRYKAWIGISGEDTGELTIVFP